MCSIFRDLCLILLFVLSWINEEVQAQDFNNNRARFRISVHQIEDAIQLDGVLDERTWFKADVAKDFVRVLPIDTGLAFSQTEVRMAYSATELFMSIVCFDTVPGKRPAESLRRDFSFGKNDNFLAFTILENPPIKIHSLHFSNKSIFKNIFTSAKI